MNIAVYELHLTGKNPLR